MGLRDFIVQQRMGQCRFEDFQASALVKGSQLLSLLLLFLISPAIALGEEATSLKQGILKNENRQLTEPEGFLSRLDNYIWRRENWGLIDEAHTIEEGTGEVKLHRWGNRLILRTPFGGFLWGYERTEGEGAISSRRNNVFGGRLHKQPFEWGRQDVREYGYVIDTKKLRRWLKNGADVPLKPLDIKGQFIFSDSDAEVGRRGIINFASENFESIQSELSAHVNRGEWYGLGFDFMYIRYNPKAFAKFTVVDQKEIVDRDLWRGRITFPVFENFHISGYYDENNDVHHFKNTNIPSVSGIPTLLIPDRSVHSLRRKYGPEIKYFFGGEDMHKATSVGFYRYTGENAGSLAEYGLKRAFRVDSAGQFSSLDLHNSFGLSIGYQEYEEAYRNNENRTKWGLNFEAGWLDSEDVSKPFSGTIFLLKRPSGALFGRSTFTIRQFDEDLKELFFKGNFTKHFVPRGNKSHPLAGELNADFSFWNIEREGKQTQTYPLISDAEVIRSFRDDRRILQLSTGYELDKPRHRFGGVYSLGIDFNWDIENSDKVGSINLGFFY